MPDYARQTHVARGAPEKFFGKKLVLDLEGCNLGRIDDAEVVTRFLTQLVAHLNMRAYGRPLVEHFGHDDPVTAGLTGVQLLETSDVTAHFSPYLGGAFIDIFSCREFDIYAAMDFCVTFFGGDLVTYTEILRGTRAGARDISEHG
jgi:S-adenosylmethionine/arginine decarboxylase-like enzyme